MQVRSGFRALKKQQEAESERRTSGKFIPYLLLSDDKDMARFRIVSSDEPEGMKDTGINSHLVFAMFHRHEQATRTGKTYFGFSVCGKSEDANGLLSGECRLCDVDNPRQEFFLVWVYVYGIYHREPSKNDKDNWTRGKIGQVTVYEEEINEFKVWRGGFAPIQSLESKLERNGNITDRDYEWIRHGARGDQQTRYELESCDPAAIPDYIIKEAQDLPDLYKIATGEITTLDGSGDESESNSPSKTYSDVKVNDKESKPPTVSDTDPDDFDFDTF